MGTKRQRVTRPHPHRSVPETLVLEKRVNECRATLSAISRQDAEYIIERTYVPSITSAKSCLPNFINFTLRLFCYTERFLMSTNHMVLFLTRY